MISHTYYDSKDILNKNTNTSIEPIDTKPNSKKLFEKEIKIISRKSSVK